ncbi:MAG TPA: peptide cleavage/export ABC transporter [Treponema sp.]|nr:peptide cleavage/export ABC transporter [Treponema sp.]
MGKIKKVLQHDESDCGAACLAIILQYYGRLVPLRKIREAAGTDSAGTSGCGIIQGAEAFGLSCKGFVSPGKENLSGIALPAIFHLKRPLLSGSNSAAGHYVVVYKIRGNTVFVSDPDKGLCRMKLAAFRECWTGIFFLASPLPSFRKNEGSTSTALRFFSLLSPHKKLLAEVLASSLLLSLSGILISFYFRFLIDEVLYSQIQSTLNLCSLCYLLIVVFQTILGFCRNQIINYVGEKVEVSLLSTFFCHLLHIPLSFFASRKTGEVLSRLKDVETIRNALSAATVSIAIDALMIFAGGFFLVKTGVQLMPAALIPVLISSAAVCAFARPFRRRIRERAAVEGDKNAAMYESINGIATIKGLSTEDKAFARVEAKIVDAAEKSVALGTMGNIQNALENLVSGCGTLALYWYGSCLIFGGKMTLGQLISFVTLAGFFLDPLKRLLTMQLYLQEVSIAAERLGDIVDIEEESSGDGQREDAADLSGDIEFRNVSFSYGSRGKALDDISFRIPAGKKVAFVGMSGSGKSTLLKLLMKFYPCQEGQILVNGADIAGYRSASYREHIGYVPQESLLFSGTISENIAWGTKRPDRTRIEASADAAQAAGFISRLPEKYESIVGEHGSTLSGGERQRLAMARVLMRDPQLLVLDEATASLDSVSEQAIMQTVYKRIRGKTVIMVAHRLSTVQDCDKIFVFNRGQLVEQGSHAALIRQRGFYHKLWTAQHEKGNHLISSE